MAEQLHAQELNLARQFSAINWLEPQRVHVLSGPSKLTCRFCTALKGLKASEVGRVGFDTREEFERHLQLEHRA